MMMQMLRKEMSIVLLPVQVVIIELSAKFLANFPANLVNNSNNLGKNGNVKVFGS